MDRNVRAADPVAGTPRHAAFLLCLAVLARSVAAAPGQSAPPAGQVVRLCETAILQCGAKPAVYLTAPDGRVEAVDALTGRVRWRAAKAAFALAARGDRVLALRTPGPPARGGCAPVLLNAGTGRIVRDLALHEVALPGCPGYSINGSCLYAPFMLDGVDYLGWVVTWHPTPGGAYRGPDFRYPPGSSGSRQGACAVDWLHAGLAPAASVLADSVAVLHPTLSAGGATVTIDGLSASADRVVESGRAVRLVLRRWRDSGRLPDVVLGEPPWNSCGSSFTADGRHVLAVWQVPDRHDPFLYHVRVFDVATAALVGEADATSWPIGGSVFGTTLVTYFPWRVFAIDLASGAERWSRPVKDLTYRGPYPPAAHPPSVHPAMPE